MPSSTQFSKSWKQITLCHACLWNSRQRVGCHHFLGYDLAPIPHMTERRLVTKSVVVSAYHIHFSNREGKWDFQTCLAWGLALSTQEPHSTSLGGSSSDRVQAFRNSWTVVPSCFEILPSPHATNAPCGSHFSRIPYITLRRALSACLTCGKLCAGTLHNNR